MLLCPYFYRSIKALSYIYWWNRTPVARVRFSHLVKHHFLCKRSRDYIHFNVLKWPDRLIRKYRRQTYQKILSSSKYSSGLNRIEHPLLSLSLFQCCHAAFPNYMGVLISESDDKLMQGKAQQVKNAFFTCRRDGWIMWKNIRVKRVDCGRSEWKR